MEEIQKKRFNFGRVFEYCLLAITFLLPIFFIPSVYVSLHSAKVSLVSLVIVLFVGAFFGNTLSSGKLIFPRSKVLIPILAFPVIALVSSYFSGVPEKSIAGEIFDFGTAGSFIMLSILFFISVFAVRKVSSGTKVIYAFLLSSCVVVLHLLLRLTGNFLPEFAAAKVPNFLVGGPTDTVVFLGASIVAILSILSYSNLGNKVKYVLFAMILVSMVYIGAVGFTFATILVGIFALVHFVYNLSWSVSPEEDRSRNFSSSLPALLVLIASVIFILSGSALSSYLSGVLKINVLEVRPNMQSTLGLVGEAMKENAILGVGPNMFKELWDMKRPLDINSTDFWTAEFNSGSGFISTVAATTGFLGLASLLVFVGFMLKMGYGAIFSSSEDSYRFLTSTSFFVALFLWITLFVYSGSFALLSITFIFSGLFIASMLLQGLVQGLEVNIFTNPRSNFVSVFFIVTAFIFSVAGGYFVWERVIASSVFNKGASQSALKMVETDRYWRAFSENSIAKLINIVNSVSSGGLNDSQRAELQVAISDSVAGIQRAIAWNPKSFENHFALGRIYEILAANGLEGALQNSIAAYTEAGYRSPSNPAVPLALARLDAVAGNFDGARENINRSLSLKRNYTDAYFTLSQIEAATNNINGAIQSAEAATILDSQNASLFFQLGLLKYNNNDFRGAISSFERAVSLVPDYANARYFLGLSYERLNRREDAIVQFEEIQKTNPNNAEVNFIFENLKAGKSPFANAQPPLNPNPEKRTELPIEE